MCIIINPIFYTVYQVSVCYELSLPASTVPQQGELVALLQHASQQDIIACVVVSPEGAIRYWPNISHGSFFGEISVDTKGQECAALIGLEV